MSDYLDPAAPCIVTAGPLAPNGYGRSNHVLAHRKAYCEYHGVTLESIQGVVVRHTCDNRPCVNPKHLLLGSHQDNMDDMVSRGRSADNRGERNPSVKLSEKDVQYIKEHHRPRHKEFSARALSKRFGVHETTIGLIVKGKRWSCQEIT